MLHAVIIQHKAGPLQP